VLNEQATQLERELFQLKQSLGEFMAGPVSRLTPRSVERDFARSLAALREELAALREHTRSMRESGYRRAWLKEDVRSRRG
jgi:ubiquinone biosynthesis protein UbiJ